MEDQDTCSCCIDPAGGDSAACPSCGVEMVCGSVFPLLRYIADSAAGMPDLYSGYGVRLFASSLSLPAMFFILHLVVKKIFCGVFFIQHGNM